MLAATGLADMLTAVQGRAATNLKALHQKYGLVVRIAPGKLSFAAPSAWKKIYGQYGFPKNYEDFEQDDSIMHTLSTASEKDHQHLRKAVAPAFANSAVRDHEPLVIKHTDYLIERTRKSIEGNECIDMVEQINWIAVDIASEASFTNSLNRQRDERSRS